MLNSIRKKILAGNGILLVLLVIVLLFTLSKLNSSDKLLHSEQIAIHQLSEIRELNNLFMDFYVYSLEFVILLQDKEKKHRDTSYQKLQTLLQENNNTVISDQAIILKTFYERVLAASTAFINDDKLTASAILSDSTSISEAIIDTLSHQYNLQKEKTENLSQKALLAGTSVRISVYILLATMLVAGTGISLLLANIISQGLVLLKNTVEEIETNNDLTLSANIISNDEVGDLSAAFNRMVSKQAIIVSEVKQHAALLASAAEELSAVTTETNRGVLQQHDAISMVATAMNQMEATVREVALNAEHASSSAEEGNTEAINGQQVVSKTVESIKILASDIQSSAQAVESLKEESVRIGSVLDVINSIAEQTNLLALNAAIEAARAGEQGRGFAVVADEVRVLAQKTQQSTSEIEGAVSSLQSGAEHAVEVMKLSLDKTEHTVEQAGLAGELLNTITRAVSNIHLMNTQIAAASEEQIATSEEINRNITAIGSVSEQTSAGALQTATASGELGKLAETLQALVSQFKV